MNKLWEFMRGHAPSVVAAVTVVTMLIIGTTFIASSTRNATASSLSRLSQFRNATAELPPLNDLTLGNPNGNIQYTSTAFTEHANSKDTFSISTPSKLSLFITNLHERQGFSWPKTPSTDPITKHYPAATYSVAETLRITTSFLAYNPATDLEEGKAPDASERVRRAHTNIDEIKKQITKNESISEATQAVVLTELQQSQAALQLYEQNHDHNALQKAFSAAQNDVLTQLSNEYYAAARAAHTASIELTNFLASYQ